MHVVVENLTFHKRRLAREKVESGSTEGVDIGAVVECFAQNLLRRHVQRSSACSFAPLVTRVFQYFCQAEVRDLDDFVSSQHDVGRLDVAMNHSFRMGMGKSP